MFSSLPPLPPSHSLSLLSTVLIPLNIQILPFNHIMSFFFISSIAITANSLHSICVSVRKENV